MEKVGARFDKKCLVADRSQSIGISTCKAVKGAVTARLQKAVKVKPDSRGRRIKS